MDESQRYEKELSEFIQDGSNLAEEIVKLMDGKRAGLAMAALGLVLETLTDNCPDDLARIWSDNLFRLSVKYLQKANGEI